MRLRHPHVGFVPGADITRHQQNALLTVLAQRDCIADFGASGPRRPAEERYSSLLKNLEI
jgi:hypothetical protein